MTHQTPPVAGLESPGRAMPRPSLADLALTWFLIGIQSLGGGSSTFYLVHQTCVQRGWLSEEEFVRDWALVQVAPGINLIKMSMLVGYRLRGWPGLLAITAGFLVPSALVTLLMTLGIDKISALPLAQSILKGVLPAAVGLSVAMGLQMLLPLAAQARREGIRSLAFALGLVLVSGLAMRLTSISPAILLLAAGFAGALLMGFFRPPEVK